MFKLPFTEKRNSFLDPSTIEVVKLENVYKTTVNILRVGLRWLTFYIISISSMTLACSKSCVIGTGVVVVAQIC